ncbi:MAG: SGNH/GDSL hydrolase family protein, partial [Pyrinomonadaceae bacterium]
YKHCAPTELVHSRTNMEQEVKIHIPRRRLTLKRRLAYAAIIYIAFLAVLAAVEIGTRLTMAHVSSLDLFVVTMQQKAQVADEKQSGIFEGDPLLLWRLKPNLDRVYWDFTILSTNAEHLRSEHVSETVGARQPGTTRIVCLGDSVTFGFRVPVVWPDKPTEYSPDWLPYPMLLEKQLRAANPDRKIEVVTMAVPGYTSHQGLAWLRRDIDELQPDLLIVSFGWNDTSFSDVPDREAIRTNWSAVGVRWLVDHSQAFAHATRWLRVREANKQTQNKPHNVRPGPRVSQQEYLSNMIAIQELARQRGAAVMVIAAPYRDHDPGAPEADFMLQYRVALGTTMRQRGVPFLEIPELTEAAYPSNEGWFGERIHPNHMGHRLMASELLKLISATHNLSDLKIPELVP